MERLRKRILEAFIFGEITGDQYEAYLDRLQGPSAIPNVHVDR